MRKHLEYVWYVIRHKWYVFVECVKLGIPLAGLTHDLSKFLPSEWFAYARFFYGAEWGEVWTRVAFDYAWLLHQHRNRHHWQFWVLQGDQGGARALPMPDRYRREMLADWIGAAKAQGKKDPGECRAWYLEQKWNMSLHPSTRRWVEEKLGLVSE